GKDWDHGVPGEHFWRVILDGCKPGAHLLAFGGTRTHHRLMCAIEDAGWEIRDCLMWIYASGFPKSLDVSKAIDKAAGMERKKIPSGTKVKRMIPGANQNRTGSWIKDSGRIYQPGTEISATKAAKQWDGWGTALKPAWEPIILARKPLIGTVAANVLEHDTGALNIDESRITPRDRKEYGLKGSSRSQGNTYGDTEGTPADFDSKKGRWPANVIHDESEEVLGRFPQSSVTGKDSAARFFYCAKASKAERGKDNNHPTVKPIALMRYLCRLITPPEGTILDPFMGSGSTGVASFLEKFAFVGIEKEPSSFKITRGRIGQIQQQCDYFDG
ncbi:MAG TPA: site-specific DNA-methyltransferase, partial [bacterium]|nr:site-specific DNA-methyltransferase [bacterium]